VYRRNCGTRGRALRLLQFTALRHKFTNSLRRCLVALAMAFSLVLLKATKPIDIEALIG
jgi:hypothetical protein